MLEGGLGHPGTGECPTTLGDSWALASCSATSVRVKTTSSRASRRRRPPGCRRPPTDRPADRSASWSGCRGVPPRRSARPAARPQPAPAATAGPRTGRASYPGRAPASTRPAPRSEAHGPVSAPSAHRQQVVVWILPPSSVDLPDPNKADPSLTSQRHGRALPRHRSGGYPRLCPVPKSRRPGRSCIGTGAWGSASRSGPRKLMIISSKAVARLTPPATCSVIPVRQARALAGPHHPFGVMLAWPPHRTMRATTPDGKRMAEAKGDTPWLDLDAGDGHPSPAEPHHRLAVVGDRDRGPARFVRTR